MPSVIDDPIAAVQDYYGYKEHALDAAAHNELAGYTIAQGNAFAHTYVSAMITFEHTGWESRLLGDARETQTTWNYYSGQDKDY